MKHIKLLISFIALFCVFAHPGTAASLPETAVSDGTNWIFHLNPSRFWQANAGDRILEEMPDEARSNLKELEKFFGSEPLNALDGITLFGPDENEENAAVVLQGDFDRERILNLVHLAEKHSTEEYGDRTIHKWESKSDGEMRYGVFAANDTIILSRAKPPLTNALDVFDGEAPSIARGELSNLIGEVPEDAFMVSGVRGISRLATDHGRAALLKNVESLSTYAAERNCVLKLAGRLRASDGQAAERMAHTVRGIISLALLNPDVAESDLVPILEAIVVKTEGRELLLALDYPSDEFFAIIQKMRRHKNVLK